VSLTNTVSTNKLEVVMNRSFLLTTLIFLCPILVRAQETAQEPPETARTAPDWYIFANAGAGIPHGDFAKGVDPGFSWGLGVECHFTRHFALQALFSRQQFKGAGGGEDFNVTEIGLLGKYYLATTGDVRPFLSAGGGRYGKNIGGGGLKEGKAGITIGGGGWFAFSQSVSLEATYKLHSLFKTTPDVVFSEIRAGVKVGISLGGCCF
jgi:opacity protein-like surface antigen